ncbi:hypothetical protein Emed_002557 [Eimeria media]
MAAFRLFCCSAAALVVFGFPANAASPNINFTQEDANGCLTVMNEARQKADLPGLTQKPLFSQDNQINPFLDFVCAVVLKVVPTDKQQPAKPVQGTLGIFEMSEDSSSYCNDAVKEWQGGYNLFASKPPVTADYEYPSLGSQHYGFVTLYNPSPGAVGECQIVDCQGTDVKEQEQSQEQLPQENGEDRGEENQEQNGAAGAPGAPRGAGGDNAESRKAKALVCLTSPDAFNNKPLFTWVAHLPLHLKYLSVALVPAYAPESCYL